VAELVGVRRVSIGFSAVNQRPVDFNLHYSDTCQVAIGQQLRIGKKWLWSARFACDSSLISQANRVPTLPPDRQLRYGTGIQYQINRDVTAGAAWKFMDAGPGPFSANRARSLAHRRHYSTNYLDFAAVNVIWKF
jgi:long-chain fatty acid transport protein